MAAPTFYNQGDQDIYNSGQHFVPQEKYRLGYTPPAAPEVIAPVPGGITNTNAFTNSGDNGQQFYTGSTNNLVSGFQSSIDDRQNRLNKPIDTSTFMGKISGFMNPQSANQIMAEGYQPKMKLGILANLLPDRYGKLSRADQAFIAQNMGYTGPTVFGENTSGLGKDPFGINTRSGFGNYGERVGVEATNLGAQLGGRLSDKYGAEFDEETGMFVGPNAAKANEMTKMMRTKLDFYRNKKIERDNLQKESLVGQMKRDKEAGAAGKSDPQDQSRTGSSGRRPGSGGNVERRDSGPDRNTDSGGTTYDSGGREGFGYGLKEGGRAGYFFGGRVNYKAGGRINFRGGGMDMGNESNQAQSAAMGNSTSAPGPGDTGGEGGNNPRDGSDTQFGDGNNNNGNERTTFFQKIKNNRIINNPLTRLVGRVGMYSVNPSLMGLDYRTASQLKGVYDKATDEVDEDDVTLNKYKQGGRVSFKNGGLASIL